LEENYIDDIDSEIELDASINETNLFSAILLKPKAAIHFIVEKCPKRNVSKLFLVGGAALAFISNAPGPSSSLITFILSGAVLGIVLGNIYASVLSSIGRRWFGGTAMTQEYRAVLSWSLVPIILAGGLMLPLKLVLGIPDVQHELLFGQPRIMILIMITGFVQLVSWAWSIIIMVKGITVIQPFEVPKAALNLFAPALTILGIVLVVSVFTVLVFK
jgi:hypothetical protein